MALAAWLWATAGIAGLLFGDGWPAGGLDVAGRVMRDLPGHLTDPRLAWPPAAQSTLPGPVAMYGVSAGLLALVLGLVAAVALRWSRRTRPAPSGPGGPVARDLQDLVVAEDPATGTGRLALGYAERGGKLIAAEARHSVCAFGPSGSGKTLSVVEPALLEWTGPAVVTSVKGDVLAATEEYRDSIGPVFVYDPTGSTGRTCSTWSPLASCTTWTGAFQMAGWLVSAAGTSGSGDGSHERFWTPLARKLLAALLFAAGATGLQMADVVRWIDRQEQAEVQTILDTLAVEEARNAFAASLARTGDTRGSVYATAEAVLDVYTDPQVAASAASSRSTLPGCWTPPGRCTWSPPRTRRTGSGRCSRPW